MIRDPYQNNRLAELVAKTTGLQTGRRIVHAITGTVIFVAVTQLDLSKSLTIAGLSVLFLILLASDLVRLRVPHLNILFFRFFQILVSPRESQNIASSTWYILGALIAIVLFPISAALSGILVLAWADPTASYLGRRWGRRSFLGGTLDPLGVPHNTSGKVSLAARRQSGTSSCMCWHSDIIRIARLKSKESIVSRTVLIAVVQTRTGVELRLRGG